MYNQIINLPYHEYIHEFEDELKEIKKSKLLTADLKSYLDRKLKEKKLWAKCFMKSMFCCGMCTTSRIEAKHKILKKYLNSGKRLSEIFQVLKEAENREIALLKNEVVKDQKVKRKKHDQSDMIRFFKDTYGDYILERLKDNLIQSVNYKITPDAEIPSLW